MLPTVNEFMYKRLREVFPYFAENDLQLKVQEFLKYMYLCSKYGGGHIPLSKEMDEIWHEFILQTREYYDLCMCLPGKKFIHHRSGSLEETFDSHGKHTTIVRLAAWVPLYYKYFGEFNAKTVELWSIVSFIMKETKLSLEEINQIARTESGKVGELLSEMKLETSVA